MTDLYYSYSTLTHHPSNDSAVLNMLLGNLRGSISASNPAFASLLWNLNPDTNPQNIQEILVHLTP